MFDKIHKRMGVFKHISIFYMFDIIEKLTTEAKNFFFYKRNIEKADNDGIFRNYNINYDKNKLYFAVNLKPEVLLMSANEITSHERLVVSNEILKIENLLSKYELYDLLKFSYDRILDEEHYAYCVSCEFNFRYWNKFNVNYVLSYIVLVTLSILYLFLK